MGRSLHVPLSEAGVHPAPLRGARGWRESSQLPQHFSVPPGCQPTAPLMAEPLGLPCQPRWNPQPTAPSLDPCPVSSVDDTTTESTTRRACQIETSSSVLLPEQPARRENSPVKH